MLQAFRTFVTEKWKKFLTQIYEARSKYDVNIILVNFRWLTAWIESINFKLKTLALKMNIQFMSLEYTIYVTR